MDFEFEVGDKVRTISGLYMSGAWREAGLKGKVVESPNEFGGLTVKFKGMDDLRFIRPSYLELRKAKKKERFDIDDEVELTEDIEAFEGEFDAGDIGVVIDVYTGEDQYEVDFNGDYLTLSGDVLKKAEPETEEQEENSDDEGGAVASLSEPEVQASLDLILARIGEIVDLLTEQKNGSTINVTQYLREQPVEEEPAPEPVFKKAKEVVAGDSLYTEAGVYDKVSRVVTKDSGYTTLFGAFGNQIVQVPSGRPLRILEPVV